MADELFDLQATFLDSSRMAPRDARRIGRMHELYGPGPNGACCGDCVSIRAQRYHDGKYTKCARFGFSRGPGTDWRLRWPACGKFERRPIQASSTTSSTSRGRTTVRVTATPGSER